MTPHERQKLVSQHIAAGQWDKAIEQAKYIPTHHDVWQTMPSMSEDGMSNDAVNKVLDHLDSHGIDKSGFLFEMAHNLMGHHDAPTLQRLADDAHKQGSFVETRNFINHPNYKEKEENVNHAKVHNFWKQYEHSVKPDHFAAIKSLYTAEPETIEHRNTKGTSSVHSDIIPHIRDYAAKVQDMVLADKDIPKRSYNGNPYIKVHRGIGGQYSKMIRSASNHDANTNQHDEKKLVIPVAPFSSWTTDRDMAERFSKGRGADLDAKGHGLVISKWMPVSDILHSGDHSFMPGRIGVHPEEKEIIFGHPSGKMKVSTKEFNYETPTETNDAQFHPAVKREKIQKAFKEKAVALATAAAMMGMPQSLAPQNVDQDIQIPSVESNSQYSGPKVQAMPGLKYIEMIESSGGKNTNHKMVRHGVNAGTKAIGRYGFMPLQVLDTVNKDKNLSVKYPEFKNYDHVKDVDKIAHKMSNPNFENEVANTHWKKLHDLFDGNENKMAHAWFNGIRGTIDSAPEEINNHDYVKKYKRYKQMMNLEHRPSLSLAKSDSTLPSEFQDIKKFEYFGGDTPEEITKVHEINKLIESRSFHKLENVGQFTRSSFVIGTNDQNSWLIKIEDGHRPAIVSAKAGLQSVKEVVFYVAAKEVFNLENVIPDSLLGEIVTENEHRPAAAIKMLPSEFRLAVDQEKEKPGSMLGILEKYRKSGILHKMALLLFVLGDGDSHGRNVMTDGYSIKLIDHGSSFADEKFTPGHDENIFIPYILRVGRLKDTMTPAEKLENMPKIDNLHIKEQLKSWVLSIDSSKLGIILNNKQIDPKPIIDRLKKLQERIGNGGSPDQVINEAWIGQSLK